MRGRIDNDGDGLIDFPGDLGCDSADDESERSIDLPCDNGLDDDLDGEVDYPADPGCASPSWPLEDPECDDHVDNDGDGFCDSPESTCEDGSLPGDPTCGLPFLLAEAPGCDDGLDNDGDGFVDMDDPGCASPADRYKTVCGLGFEVVLVLPLILLARARRRLRGGTGERAVASGSRDTLRIDHSGADGGDPLCCRVQSNSA